MQITATGTSDTSTTVAPKAPPASATTAAPKAPPAAVTTAPPKAPPAAVTTAPATSKKPLEVTTEAIDAKLSPAAASVAPSPHPGECVCVPFHLCKEGEIITDGAGIIDIRISAIKSKSATTIRHPQSDSDRFETDLTPGSIAWYFETGLRPTGKRLRPNSGRFYLKPVSTNWGTGFGQS